MRRRSFIQQSSLVAANLWVPSFLRLDQVDSAERSRSGQILVVIQLSGGNDGLNTVVPVQNDIYHRLRPGLRLDPQSVITLDEQTGLNPALRALRPLVDQGEMSIVHAVGYPNPDRSHFRSMDIWQTASDSETYLQTGWLGRYLDSECSGCEKPYQAIELGDNLSLALKGQYRDGFAMRSAAKLRQATANPLHHQLARKHETIRDNDNLDYLYKTMIEVQESAHYLSQQAKRTRSSQTYPSNQFARGLKQIAELIMADTATKIYYISLPGFDTHVNQKARQERLLKMYAEAVAAFVQDLKSHRLFQDTAILTFSEFGRRVKENGSRGTDHGAANNLFVMGGRLRRPGMYNAAPDLSDLDDGDIRYQVDFRNVYANILEDWLDVSPQTILPNHLGQKENLL